MAISETCGNCGSSIELDRNDEVELWRSWQRTHLCKDQDQGAIINPMTQIERTETPFGFTRPTQFDE